MNRTFAWPVGQDRPHPQLSVLTAHAVGGAAGGFLLAVGILMATMLSQHAVGAGPRVAIGILVAIAGVVSEVLNRLPAPFQQSRQVRRDLQARLPMRFVAFEYGVELGIGLATWIHHGAIYVAIGSLIALNDPVMTLGAGVAFGVARGLQPVGWSFGVRSEQQALRVEHGLRHPSYLATTRNVITVVALALTVVVGLNADVLAT